MASPYIVGLTGGIGCGKSTVTHTLAQLGAAIVDTDLIAHALTAAHGAAMPELRAAFGPAAIAPDGALDRRYIRELVFNDPTQRVRLEACLHPMIRQQAELELAAARGDYTVLVVPLLVESPHFQARCQHIVTIECEPDVQLRRVMARSGLTAEQVTRIVAAQASSAARQALADDVIYNNGELAALNAALHALHTRLTGFAALR